MTFALQERMKSIINCATSVLVASSRQQGTTLAAPVRLVPLRQRWAVSHASPVQQALIQVKPVESAAPVLQAPFHLEQVELADAANLAALPSPL